MELLKEPIFAREKLFLPAFPVKSFEARRQQKSKALHGERSRNFLSRSIDVNLGTLQEILKQNKNPILRPVYRDKRTNDTKVPESAYYPKRVKLVNLTFMNFPLENSPKSNDNSRKQPLSKSRFSKKYENEILISKLNETKKNFYESESQGSFEESCILQTAKYAKNTNSLLRKKLSSAGTSDESVIEFKASKLADFEMHDNFNTEREPVIDFACQIDMKPKEVLTQRKRIVSRVVNRDNLLIKGSHFNQIPETSPDPGNPDLILNSKYALIN